MNREIRERANQILDDLKRDNELGRYVDSSFPIPHAYHGSGEIKLIVLGQDPTVKNTNARKKIKTVLNLDKNGSVTAYLSGVCKTLGISLRENVYATNVYKNFFTQPPTTIDEIDVFDEYFGVWFPLLQDEVAVFGDLPVLTLGEPILSPLLKAGRAVSTKVRGYWGYQKEWRTGRSQPFGYVRAEDNKLGRKMFPFPHQPSLRKKFYKVNLMRYSLYMKDSVFMS